MILYCKCVCVCERVVENVCVFVSATVRHLSGEGGFAITLNEREREREGYMLLRFRYLVKSASSKVGSNDDVSNSIEYKLDIIGIGSASHMAIYFFRCRFILGFELRLNVSGRFTVFLRAYKMMI